jgi:hypothetical protein
VLVMDRNAPELANTDPADVLTLQSDLMMLTANGGLERTLKEFQALFDAAGLRLERVTPTQSGFAIMETRAA